MIFGSVCSGIEAASVAWKPLGWRCAFMSEIDKFPRAVLAQHYPETPLHGDFTTIEAGQYEPIDVLVGGTPCQDFSVAGLRAGIAGDRGNLTLEYLRLASRLNSRWIVWENVPGVLSSDGGRALGAFLGGLAQLGYGFAYRVLDAQFFGLAQRRERVFVVGYLGDWRPPAAVLFEFESLSGHPAPRREAGQGFAAPTAPSLTASGRGVERTGESRGQDPVIAETLRGHPRPGSNSLGAIAYGGNNTAGPIDVATAVNAHGGPYGRQDFESETSIAHTLRAEGYDASEDGTGRGVPLVPTPIDMRQASRGDKMTNNRRDGSSGGAPGTGIGEPGDPSPTIAASHIPAIAFSAKDHGADAGEISPTLRAMGHSGSHANAGGQVAVSSAASVRRLTPRECCRLQGFPGDYLDIIYRGKPAADGPKYKALGNSMAVPVMAWIGRRIDMVERLMAENSVIG